MAEVYGNKIGHWQAHVTCNITEQGSDWVNLLVVTSIHTSDGWNYSGIKGGAGAYANNVGGAKEWSGDVPVNGDTNIIQYSVYGIKKGRTAQDISYAGYVNLVGYAAGSSTAYGSIRIGAKPSHTVSFNANGGSGAPGNQTKWYGEILTLSATKPTRANYTFLGWATSSGGAVAYQPGGQYGYDQNVTLYAKWKLNASPPTIGAFTAYRCNASGTAQTDGTYVKMACTWNVDTTGDTTNACTSLKFAVQKDDGGWTDYVASASNGTGTTTTSIQNGFAAARSWNLRVTLSDRHATTVAYTTIGPATYILDLNANGTGIGIGQIAPSQGVAVYGSPLNLNGTVKINNHDAGSLFESVTRTLIASEYGTVIGVKRAGVCMIHVDWKSANTASWGAGSFGTLPVGWRPVMAMLMPFPGRDGASQRNLVVKADGTMTYQNQGGGQNGGPFSGTFTYLSANL